MALLNSAMPALLASGPPTMRTSHQKAPPPLQNGKMGHFAFTRSHRFALRLSLPSLPPSPFDDEVHHHKKEINRDSDRDGSGRGDDKPPPSLRPSLFASLYWARLKNISQVV